jgi:hypothetical protein
MSLPRCWALTNSSRTFRGWRRERTVIIARAQWLCAKHFLPGPRTVAQSTQSRK